MRTNKSIAVIMSIAVAMIVGVYIGHLSTSTTTGTTGLTQTNGYKKINALLHIIEKDYVDTVDISKIVEGAIPKVLSELDPHSIYIPAKDLEATNAGLNGSFGGIGIQFSIQKDTIHVNQVIHGGPSEKVGLMPGDRIVTINDSLFVGKEVTVQSAPQRLKGPKGTDVKLGILRTGEKQLLHFNITRDNIPIYSVDATLMLTPKWGYIKLNKFGRTTYSEVITSIARLKQQNCKGLIFDLRGNTGGYLEAATQVINEFLSKKDLIVYTKGKKWTRNDIYANGMGSCKDLPLVILIDEGSASASEIFSGAIQDNDRGTIIGRRSFGKGLVQEPVEFMDGSAIRLTVARYYTPSGRCIQKPYVDGADEKYQMDILERYEHGEFFSKDSIKQNKEIVYRTKIGRKVYGGGGIMPDIFVPQDTLNYTPYYRTVVNRGVPLSFAFQYTDKHRKELEVFTNTLDLYNYLKQQDLVKQLVNYASSKGVTKRNKQIYKSRELLDKYVSGSIIYNILGLESYIGFLNSTDKTIQKAINILDKGEWLPKPSKKAEEK
ncbi:MAG: S41 family peptidase [Bacteroidaceae bacterium]|nr:S41 family peptidase [Bacteroidaceae bacterium]